MTDLSTPPRLPPSDRQSAGPDSAALAAARMELQVIVSAVRGWLATGVPIAARGAEARDLTARLNSAAATIAAQPNGRSILAGLLAAELRGGGLAPEDLVRALRTRQRYGPKRRGR